MNKKLKWFEKDGLTQAIGFKGLNYVIDRSVLNGYDLEIGFGNSDIFADINMHGTIDSAKNTAQKFENNFYE